MAVEEKPPPRRPPWWVRVLLWGSSGRRGVLLYMWISLALTGAFFVAGFWYQPLFIGTCLILSALGYWTAISWVDRHGTWPDKKG